MPNVPDWFAKATELEAEDRLIEAENTIRDNVRDQGFAISIAEMYRKRMLRLLEKGDSAGAAEARQKASDWAYFYASQATSGSEGLVLSAQRDEFLKLL
jgi:hypothetical protein